MAAKRPAIGARVTVVVATKKTKDGSKTFYSYMPKAVADLFGFKAIAAPKSKSKVKGREGTLLRGSIGAGSIKVPIGKPTTKKVGGKTVKVQKYRSIPIPNGVSNAGIAAFLRKATKNKPEKFVSKDGRTYPVTQGK